MGKYASRDGSSSVAWADITGKPATFTPAAHSNTAHSTAYAPLDSPSFTTHIENNGLEYWRGNTRILNKAGSDWINLFTRNTTLSEAVMTLENIGDINIKGVGWAVKFDSTGAAGSHTIGVTSDYWFSFINSRGAGSRIDMTHNAGIQFTYDGAERARVDAAGIITQALRTANFGWYEESGEFVLKYGSTIIARFNNAGYLRTKDDMEPKASMAI